MLKELNHPMKELINIQNNDNRCFLWCHVRHLKLDGKNLWRISENDKEISKGLNYSGIDFPVSKKEYSKIEVLNKICINVFCDEKTVYPVYIFNKIFRGSRDLLLVGDHYAHIKHFNRLMFNKTKNRNRKWFCKRCLECFSSNFRLEEHKKDCSIVQNVKLENRFIEFKNFSRMIPALFKIYADFECLLKIVILELIMMSILTLENIKTIFHVVLLIN